MRRVIVRYKVKPERAAENVSLIEQVFAQLTSEQPDGVRYATFKLEDGVSFVHVASVSTPNGENPLAALPAFKAFVANIADRCEEKPVTSSATAILVYRADDAPA